MKRKIFSKLLMGAFLIASVSSFVSCKDYDDDINNLQKQIDAAALKAELTTLQTNLAAQIAAAQSAAQAAQAAAEKAQATANNAATKDALEAVKTLATAAGTDAAKAIADAANAQNTADVAKSAATAAQEAAAAAQNVANGASDKAATALADAAKALATAEAANATATAANAAASAADATAKEAKATADNAIAAAGNATTQAADALKAAGEAKAAAEAAKYNDEAVKLLIAQAQASADAAAEDAKEAAEAAAAAVLASASATEDAATAKEAAAKAEETIKDAIANATKAIEEATDAKIKAAVAEAVAKIPSDQSAAVEALKGDLKTLADAQADFATATALDDAVEGLKTQLGEAVDAATIAAVAAAAGTIDAAVAELYAAVTSVELVGTYTGDIWPDADAQTYPLGFTASTSTNITLDFIFGKMKWDGTFGDHETESMDDDAVEKYEYKAGQDIRANRALLIRVNPVNATFDKGQVKFINSKLETLDDIIDIGEPYRFKGMITRSSQESGLWVIPVSVKKDVDYNTFNKTTWYKASGDWKYDKTTGDVLYPGQNKLYAVAINNTPDMDDAEGIARYVASTYDVAADYVHYTPAYTLNALFEWSLGDDDFLGTTKIGGYYDTYTKTTYSTVVPNRWTTYANYVDPTSGVRSMDQDNAYSVVEECHEKAWNTFGKSTYSDIVNTDAYKGGVIVPHEYEPNKPTEKEVKGTKYKDAVDDGDDYRYGYPYLTIANTGDPIRVYLPTALQKKVEYWYISYDFEQNAVESKPSEWEAWQSYQDGIEGIYKTVPGDKPIDLVVNKPTAQGDVIGFRIWAVNYDGSLVDPDGKAFYIKIGEEPEAKELAINVDIMAVNATKGMALDYVQDTSDKYTADNDFNVSVIKEITGNEFASLKLDSWYASHAQSSWSNSSKKRNGTVSIYYALLDKDKKVATDWKNVKYIKAGIAGTQLKNWRNGSDGTLTYSFDGYRNDVNNKEAYRIKINFTKKMPDDAWTKAHHFDGKITWKPEAGYDAAQNELTVYAKPYFENGFKLLQPTYDGTVTSGPNFWWNNKNKLCEFINDAAWLNWTDNTKPANAGVRQIYDYISKPETSDLAFPRNLYKFQFVNLPTECTADGAPRNKNYETEWDGTTDAFKGNYTVVAVMPKAVREDTKYTTNLVYTYENISLVRNSADDGWEPDNNWYKNATTFTTDFKDAIDLLPYTTEVTYLKYDKWVKNDIDVAVRKEILTKTDANVYIAWKGLNGTFDWSTADPEAQNGATPVFFQLAMDDKTWETIGVDPSKEFVVGTYEKNYALATTPTNNVGSFLKSTIGTKAWTLAQGALVSGNYTGAGLNHYIFQPSHHMFDNPATDEDETGKMEIKLTGQIAKYLKVVKTSTVNNVVLEKISGIASPTQNWDGSLELSGYDVFGKKHTYSIPLVLLFNK